MFGILQLPWWGYIVVTLILTQITILGVTVFLHRCQAHRALELHPIISHFFRFWLWLTTGMETKQWAAVHRKHHAKVETSEDPHSPVAKGIKKVFFEGAELYRRESHNKETMERYGAGTPDDWMERNVYTAHSAKGILLMFIIDVVLFGPLGISIWAVQMAWIPFFAAGVVNGIGHYFGYRNFECADASRNIVPWGLFIGGEELHNNHHTYGTSAKFSVKWYEFDMGWMVIRFLQIFGLAKPKRVPPSAKLVKGKSAVDIDTLKAVLTHRFQVLAHYSQDVIMPVLREERRRAGQAGRDVLKRVRSLLVRDTTLIDSLQVVYQFRLKLQGIWAKSTASQKELLESLQEWCRQAEATGIDALRDFVKHLKGYMPQTA
jgi:stearoyl-CoA desaturase (delta-9 desaturase)